MNALGIDIGGTSTRIGLIDSTGEVKAMQRLDSSGVFVVPDTLAALSALIEKMRRQTESEGGPVCVGLAVPGILDDDRQRVVRSVHLPGLEGLNITDKLAKTIGLPVFLFTDAEAATWGEFATLDPAPHRFVHLRVGTGIACGVVLERELQRLDRNRMQHLDVLVVDDGANAVVCRCGKRGCLEAIAGGAELQEQARKIGCEGGLAELRARYLQGDKPASEIIRYAANALETAVTKVMKRFDSEAIVIGGGVIAAIPELFDLLFVPEDGCYSIALARLGDDAGVMGAAKLALRMQN